MNPWPQDLFDILTHHSSTRGASKQLLDRSHINAFQFSASLGLEMNALCQSKKTGDHMWVLRCCCAKSRKATDEDLTEVIEKLKNNEDLNRCVFSSKNPRSP